MKKTKPNYGFVTTRNLIALILCTAAFSLAAFSVAAKSSSKKLTTKNQRTSIAPKPVLSPDAPTPGNATLTSANIGSANALNYMDSVGAPVTNLTFFAGSGTCAVPMSCSTYTLTIDPSVGAASGGYDPTKYQVYIEADWALAAQDYDTWMCSGSGNCVQANVVAQNNSTADPEVIILP